MPILDYSVPSFALLVGGVDYSACLTRLSISQGISEPEDYLNWSGEFELSYTLEAQRDGLSFAINAGQQVDLRFFGATALIMRVAEYRYDANTGEATGKLTQRLQQKDQQKPSAEISLPVGSNSDVREAIAQLVDSTGLDMQSGYLTRGALTESISSPITSDRPIGDAQQFAASLWLWLYTSSVLFGMETNERVGLVQRSTNNPIVFVRSASQFEYEPNLDALAFPATEVLVSGVSEQVSPNDDDDEEEPEPDDSVDDEGRSRKFVTETTGILENVFSDKTPSELGVGRTFPNGTPFLQERKVVYYLYFDQQDAFDIYGGVAAALGLQETLSRDVLQEIQDVLALYQNLVFAAQPPTTDQPVATLSLSLRTREEVFPDLFTNPLSLIVASATLESWERKSQFEPIGKVVTSRDFSGSNNLPLVLKSRESLNEGTPGAKRVFKFTTVDPTTGRSRELERPKEREAPQLKPEFKVSTTPALGRSRISPTGYTPPDSTLVRNVGFVPSKRAAEFLARELSRREYQRSQSILVTMPIPREWTAQQCPPFSRVRLDTGEYLMDAPILTIEEGEASLSFTAEYVGAIAQIPDTPDPTPFIPSGSLQLVPMPGLVLVRGGEITPIQFEAIGGVPPYTFSAVSLPDGLSLSSGGLLTGTPTTATDALFTITVGDSAP